VVALELPTVMAPAILCENLYKRYGNGKKAVDAVNGIDLAVPRGECFGLLGPNGAGKTTTVEIFEGLLPPTAGRIEILGRQWGRGEDQVIRQQIGITLQDTKFQERLSCLEILTLFRSFYREGIRPREALQLVSLEEKSHAWIRDLSGGQKQRLAVAAALVGDPQLLFLDEPTTGLDPQARRQLWDVVLGLRKRGRTILLTTHYMDEAEKLCDRVAVVDHGRVIALGSPRQLISRLGGEHVIEFSVESDDNHSPEAREFLSVEAATGCVRDSGGFLMTVTQPHLAIPSLLSYLARHELTLNRLTTRHVNLEDVFVSLTGRHLRDA
jgi:ABC-2 type transport system ATP-binding protein